MMMIMIDDYDGGEGGGKYIIRYKINFGGKFFKALAPTLWPQCYKKSRP
jgi:hypothetical protein